MKTASNTQQLGTKIEENCDFKEILQKIQTHTHTQRYIQQKQKQTVEKTSNKKQMKYLYTSYRSMLR